MLKKIITTALVAIALIFSGCGDPEGEDRLKAQYAVDQGDNQVAIDLLTSKKSLSMDEKILLASAYMGRAGFTMIDTMIAFAQASEGTNVDDLINLKNTLLSQSTSTADADLILAIDTFSMIDTPNDDTNLKLALAFIVKVVILLDSDTSDSVLAETANEGFNLILKIAPDELKQDVTDIKNEIDTNLDGDISSTEIASYTPYN